MVRDTAIFEIIENLNNLADGKTEDQFMDELELLHVYYKCVDSPEIKSACECVEDQNYIQISDCWTDQDLGIALASERGLLHHFRYARERSDPLP